jgi:hypothetical protein
MTDQHVDAIDDVDATLSIVDGRVAMSADGGATLHLKTPDPAPLSRNETRFTLRVVGDDYRAEVELDTDDVQMLQQAVGEIGEPDQ